MAIPDCVWQKLDHAKFHLNLLNAETSRYLHSNPGEFVPNPHTDTERPTFIFQQQFAPPVRISLIAGDALQAVRSSLDYLVWELVLLADNKPAKQNAFPVCITERAFEDALRGRRLNGISDEAKTLIRSLQPYGYFHPLGHWLALLDELANINKHRRILVSALNGFSMRAVIEYVENGVGWFNQRDADNTKGGSIFTPEQMAMQGDLVPYVAFHEGAVENMEVGIVIDTYIGLATQTIEQFDRFF